MSLTWGKITALACVTLAALARAQFVPSAPVQDFKLYGFDEETGWRVWQIEGSSGAFVDENAPVQIKNMRLRTYQASDEQAVELRIDSPQALVDPKARTAVGPSELVVRGPTFYVRGEDWSWNGATETLHIKRNAHVTIRGEFGALIR